MNHKIIRQETKRYHQMFVINATISNLAIHTVTIRVVSKLPCRQGCQKWLWVLVEELFLDPSKGRTVYKPIQQIGNTDSHLQCNLGLF